MGASTVPTATQRDSTRTAVIERQVAWPRSSGCKARPNRSTATTPVLNIPDYPDIEPLLEKIRSLPRSVQVDATKVARECGSMRAANMVLVGCASPLLPIEQETMEHFIEHTFARKGEDVVAANIKAFRAGRDLAEKTASKT